MTEQTAGVAIVYAAKSTTDLHGSIGTQLADSRQLAESRGLRLVAEYSDEAASAFKADRGPGLAQALEHAERLAAEQGACALIVQHTDRLARGDGVQARHLIEIVLWAAKAGVELLSLQDPEMVSGGELGLLMGAIGGMRNHQDSKRKGAAVKSGIRRRAVDRRQFIGGRRPFGYRHRDTRPDGGGTGPLVIDEAEAAIVRRIFAEYLAGSSQRSIANGLNASEDGKRPQVPTLTGAKWYATTIAGMLQNGLYAGRVTIGDESYPAVAADGTPTVPAIIDPETWQAATERRTTLAQTPGRGRGRRTTGTHLFTSGLLRCGCGAPMSPVRKRTRTPGQDYERYVCTKRLHHGVEACATAGQARDGRLCRMGLLSSRRVRYRRHARDDRAPDIGAARRGSHAAPARQHGAGPRAGRS